MQLAYDLHIHSCLSPCGSEDMTPANIALMASLKELDVIALTDHNSTKNCPALMENAKQYGILVIPGMELCTREEVHVLCLFLELKDAMQFDEYVYSKLIPFPNQVQIFGNQEIYNEFDEKIGEEPNLLINATQIAFDDVYDLVSQYHGIMIPAHIDKNAYSVLSNLGFLPPDSKFRNVEIKDKNKTEDLIKLHPYLEHCSIISNSDAHYLEYINERVNYMNVAKKDINSIFQILGI